MNIIIIQSIREKMLLELRYSGFSRLVEPHAYGRDKDGDEILRCYQVSGGSTSGEKVGWKLLKTRDIYSLHLLKDKFQMQKAYKRNDKAMSYIFEQI